MIFYIGEIILALEELHALGIVYRDLKLENIMIDSVGHIKLIDFGFSKYLGLKNEQRTYTSCGTPAYIAPEVYNKLGHGYEVDVWALGVIIFELITGYNPFFEGEQINFGKVCQADINWPHNMDKMAKDLI